MARTRKSVPRLKRPSSSQISEALRDTLNREFADHVATRSVPAADDRRGRAQYEASLRRMALAKQDVSVIDPGASGYPGAGDGAPVGQRVRDLTSIGRGKLTISSSSAIRLGDGLYDFYPPDLPVHSLWSHQPFTAPFPLSKGSPADSMILLSLPQIGVGRFYASASTIQNPVDRFAKVWCGTLLPIDPNLHDDAHGIKDVAVWAEGTISYDYALSATPGPAWSGTRSEAAHAGVFVEARLLRFDRTTSLRNPADETAPITQWAYKQSVRAGLQPNGQTTSPPSTPSPSVGGSYAAWSTGPTPFEITLRDGPSRKLETDSTYHVAVICSLDLGALGSPGSVASAEVSALMFLRLVTIGVFAHDPSVTL